MHNFFPAVCGTCWVLVFPAMVFLHVTLTGPVDEVDKRKHPTMCIFAKAPKAIPNPRKGRDLSQESVENSKNDEKCTKERKKRTHSE